jgi:hypothetical protein
MDAIEPHWISLLWFAAFATTCAVAFLVVAGMFPLRSRPDSAKSAAATLLVVGNAVLLIVLLTGTGWYGYTELRWSSLIVVGRAVRAGTFRSVAAAAARWERRADRVGGHPGDGSCGPGEGRRSSVGDHVIGWEDRQCL